MKKDRLPILKKVYGAFLRSLRKQDCKKCLLFGELRVSETLREANSEFSPARRGLQPHHWIEAVVDWGGKVAFVGFKVSLSLKLKLVYS